jgi:hypothetical protein
MVDGDELALRQAARERAFDGLALPTGKLGIEMHPEGLTGDRRVARLLEREQVRATLVRVARQLAQRTEPDERERSRPFLSYGRHADV